MSAAVLDSATYPILREKVGAIAEPEFERLLEAQEFKVQARPTLPRDPFALRYETLNYFQMREWTRPAPAPRRIRVWYDHSSRGLVEEDLKTFGQRRVSRIALDRATFIVEPGVRAGCDPGGLLGFVEGHEAAWDDSGELERVRWSGQNFVASSGPVWAARSVPIEGGQIQAAGCIPL